MSYFEEDHLEVTISDPKKLHLQKEDICGGNVSKNLKLVSRTEIDATEAHYRKAIRKLTQKYAFLNER